jgi:hypothetical protein
MSVDFQRLERVRARQSSRRKRWLRGLSTLVMAAVILAVSRLVVPMIPGLLPALERNLPVLTRGASLVGEVLAEAQGRVEIVERAAGIIRVSSGFLGLMSVELVVTPETLIVVGDKEGGFGDLREGERVIATYEVRPDTLWAKRVEVFAQSSSIASPGSLR